MIFKPAANYDGLLKQARALSTINIGLSAQLAFYRAKDYTLSEARLARLEAELESEKNMNAQLTDELEAITDAS